MFRLRNDNLPKDPVYPADLEALGFFINSAGQIRMIDYPDKDYVYWHTNNERHNDVRREAMQTCQRNEVMSRLYKLGLQKIYLPQLQSNKPEEAHTAILIPPIEILQKQKRVIVLVNDGLQDLGILAYRSLQRELGLNGGSIVNFVKYLITRSLKNEDGVDVDLYEDGNGVDEDGNDTPGLIIMNCGQLLYSYKLEQPLTVRSWGALERKSMAHDQIEILDENHIQGNRDAKEHIKFVIDRIIKNDSYVATDAEVYIIAIEGGAEKLLEVLGVDFDRYGSRITAMALVNPFVKSSQIRDPYLKSFLHQRARQWNVASSSNDPRECIEAPHHYMEALRVFDQTHKDTTPESETTKELEPISWLEKRSYPDPFHDTFPSTKHFVILEKPTPKTAEGIPDDRDDIEPICPTFADAENPQGAGECVFTNRDVQDAILDFFEEVARNPFRYQNPAFRAPATKKTSNWVSETLAKEQGEDGGATAFQPLQVSEEMTMERIALNTKEAELQRMRTSLSTTSVSDPKLGPGRENLEKRIAKLGRELEDLTIKTLAVGGMKSGEAEDLRENWKPVGTGPKIPFAGTMVDSELVKGAGLIDTAEEELAGLDSGNEV